MALPQSVGGGGLKLQFLDFMLWWWVAVGQSASKNILLLLLFLTAHSHLLPVSQKTTAPPRRALQVVLDARSNAFMCSTSVMERAKRWTLPRRPGSHYHFSIPPSLQISLLFRTELSSSCYAIILWLLILQPILLVPCNDSKEIHATAHLRFHVVCNRGFLMMVQGKKYTFPIIDISLRWLRRCRHSSWTCSRTWCGMLQAWRAARLGSPSWWQSSWRDHSARDLRCRFEEVVRFQTFHSFFFGCLSPCSCHLVVQILQWAISQFFVWETVFLEKCRCLNHPEFQHPTGGHSFCFPWIFSLLAIPAKRIQNHWILKDSIGYLQHLNSSEACMYHPKCKLWRPQPGKDAEICQHHFSLRKHPNLPFHFAAELLKGLKIDADAEPWIFGTGDGKYGRC